MAKNDKHNLVKRGDVWYFTASKNGKRYHEALSTNFREAKQIRDEYLYELRYYGYLKKEGQKEEVQRESERMLFGEITTQWLELQEQRLKKDDLKLTTLRD